MSIVLPEPRDYSEFTPFLKGVFSQWHETVFTIDGRAFNTAEQWMMFGKARLFGDEAMARSIMATASPAEQKRFGQRVSGFEKEVWDREKVPLVFRGNYEKFRQNPGALRRLLATGQTMLVEANPLDWIWSCGLRAEDPRISRPAEWVGENLLGRVLTAVRDRLRSEAS